MFFAHLAGCVLFGVCRMSEEKSLLGLIGVSFKILSIRRGIRALRVI